MAIQNEGLAANISTKLTPATFHIITEKNNFHEHVEEVEVSSPSTSESSDITSDVSFDRSNESDAHDATTFDKSKTSQDNTTTFFGQQEHSHFTSGLTATESMLIVSPYVEPAHQLNLSTLDTPNQLLALALTSLQAATPSYATVNYQESLNWSSVFLKLQDLVTQRQIFWPKTTFYVVEFRSQVKAERDVPLLFKLDKESHREATASGGLLKYWYGEPDTDRRNLATCEFRFM